MHHAALMLLKNVHDIPDTLSAVAKSGSTVPGRLPRGPFASPTLEDLVNRPFSEGRSGSTSGSPAEHLHVPGFVVAAQQAWDRPKSIKGAARATSLLRSNYDAIAAICSLAAQTLRRRGVVQPHLEALRFPMPHAAFLHL